MMVRWRAMFIQGGAVSKPPDETHRACIRLATGRAHLQRQRRCVLQPGVVRVREGYPGLTMVIIHNPNGVVSFVASHQDTTPLGLLVFFLRYPARQSRNQKEEESYTEDTENHRDWGGHQDSTHFHAKESPLLGHGLRSAAQPQPKGTHEARCVKSQIPKSQIPNSKTRHRRLEMHLLQRRIVHVCVRFCGIILHLPG